MRTWERWGPGRKSSRGRQGDDGPGSKSVPPGQGKRAVTGTRSVIRPPVAGGGSKSTALVMTSAFYPKYGQRQPLRGRNACRVFVPFVQRIPRCGRSWPRCGQSSAACSGPPASTPAGPDRAGRAATETGLSVI
jgi:hypothetical protein